MATKTNPPGLFGKIVQRLRAPAAAPADNDESVQSPDSKMEKLALNERIAIRRKDDMIRRREFSYLRKVRAQNQHGLSGTVPRPSLFSNSSSFNQEDQTPQERARTVKKIDAIEAHMVEFWAQKRRQGLANAPVAASGAPKQPPTLPITSRVLPEAESAAGDMDLDFTKELADDPYAATQPAPLVPKVSAPQPPLMAFPVLTTTAEPAKAPVNTVHNSEFPSQFSNSRATSVELGDDIDNPALQDAAIRFADGDEAGAEAALLAVMQATDASADAADACATALLDLYRATDQATSFEEVAIEYAQRFGRSAPEWFSVPDRLRRAAAASAVVTTVATGSASAAGWECPTELALPAVQMVRTTQRSATARHVRWDALRTIHPEAAQALKELFTEWATLPLDLHFSGAEVLNNVLQAATPPDQPDTDPLWWHLRLEALRIQGRQEEFENVALDYCVVYEVSPPSWLEADCTFVHESEGSTTAQMQPGSDSGFAPLDVTPEPSTKLLELRGEIQGDADQILQDLLAQLRPGDPMVISLALVIRVDFPAAASILNWLVAHQSTTGRVQFVHVPRLVAAFFEVMGITGVADISLVKAAP